MTKKLHVQAKINGKDTDFLCEPRQSLLEVLRDELQLTGTKEGCNNGNCGACNVLLDGRLVNSCLVLGAEDRGPGGANDRRRRRAAELASAAAEVPGECRLQCGICTPGFIVAAKALLDTQSPTRPSTRSGTGWPAICAAAPATTRSSARCSMRRMPLQPCKVIQSYVLNRFSLEPSNGRFDSPAWRLDRARRSHGSRRRGRRLHQDRRHPSRKFRSATPTCPASTASATAASARSPARWTRPPSTACSTRKSSSTTARSTPGRFPIAFPVDKALAGSLKAGETVALVNSKNEIVGTLKISDIFPWDKATLHQGRLRHRAHRSSRRPHGA